MDSEKEASHRGLDFRSPDDRLTYRNRVAKELQHCSLTTIRDMAAKVSGEPTSSFNRVKAIQAIANDRIHIIRTGQKLAG